MARNWVQSEAIHTKLHLGDAQGEALQPRTFSFFIIYFWLMRRVALCALAVRAGLGGHGREEDRKALWLAVGQRHVSTTQVLVP